MCQCGTRNPQRPSQSPGAGSSTGPPNPCVGAQRSGILLIDELGIPIASTAVRLTIGGVVSNTSSDGNGYLLFTHPPGTSVTVELADMHEARAGDSTNTPSGQHFRANGTGP